MKKFEYRDYNFTIQYSEILVYVYCDELPTFMITGDSLNDAVEETKEFIDSYII